MKLFSKQWVSDTLERCIYTMAETAIGVIGSAKLMGEVKWQLVGGAVALSAVITFLKCILVTKQ